jgi:hypothetical protein
MQRGTGNEGRRGAWHAFPCEEFRGEPVSSRSPHRHPNTRSDAELDEVIASNPALQGHLAKTPKVNETKDVPDTGGYAKDADEVFIDRHLARAAPEIEGQPYSVWRQAVVDHEWMEKGLIQILQYTYEHAHQLASIYENRKVLALGMKPFKYNKGLKPFIKRDAVEKITVPPPDLDCTPYRPDHHADDRRILVRLRQLGVADADETEEENHGKTDDHPQPPSAEELFKDKVIHRAGMGARDSPMDFDERTNQSIRELRGLGVTFPDDLDQRTCQLARELAAEKAAQLEGAKAVISPLVFIIIVAVFALCFWRYDMGMVFSVGAAILAIPVIWLGICLPIGYVLGSRAARRFKARLHEEGGAH